MELARLTAVVRATTYSELKPMNNQDLTDQLKHLKLVLGRDIKKTSLPNRKAYVIRIQTPLFTEFGVGANNLEDCDDGYGGDGMRKRKASKMRGSGSGKLIKYLGFEWYANEEFEIDHLIDHMVADGGIVEVRCPQDWDRSCLDWRVKTGFLRIGVSFPELSGLACRLWVSQDS